MKKTQPDWISSRECAARLGVHRSTITRWAKRGLLPAWRLGGVLRVDWRAAELQGTRLLDVAAASVSPVGETSKSSRHARASRMPAGTPDEIIVNPAAASASRPDLEGS